MNRPPGVPWQIDLRRKHFPDKPPHIGVLLDNVEGFRLLARWCGAGRGRDRRGSTRPGDRPIWPDIRHADCQLIVTDAARLDLALALDHGLDPAAILCIDDPAYAAALDRHREQLAAAPGSGPGSCCCCCSPRAPRGPPAVRCTQGRLARIAHTAAGSSGTSATTSNTVVCHCFTATRSWRCGPWPRRWRHSVPDTIVLGVGFPCPTCATSGATFFTYVGKALGYLLATPAAADDADNTLQRGFGTEASPRISPSSGAASARCFEGYGSSEGGAVVLPDPAAPRARWAAGTRRRRDRRSGDDATLCRSGSGPHGRVLNADAAVGEIVDQRGVRDFEGYYRNDSADADRVERLVLDRGSGLPRRGWFLYFAGRRGDWIRVDGENASALGIERVLRRHPEVIAAGVYGVPDPRSGIR